MAFKFPVGHAVEYKPQGRSAGLFEVTRHMPEEDGAAGRKYRIKSVREDFERTVTEYDLEPADISEGAYTLLIKSPKAISKK